MTSPYQISEETLAMSSQQRGLPGMISKVAPGPNMYDQGATSKPSVNSQLESNQRLKMQEMSRNIESASPQAATGAARAVSAKVDEASNAENKAQTFAAQRMSEVLYANQSGNKLMELNSVLQSPERSAYLNQIATGKALAAGMNPDLGAEVADKARYVG